MLPAMSQARFPPRPNLSAVRNAVIVVLLLAGCASTPPRDYTPAIDASRAQIEALVAKEKIPGAAVAVSVGDRIVWHDTFGVTNLETKAPVRMETRFRVGSLTKLMTVTALMRLVQDGRLRLDDPVSRHLPDFPHGEITLRQLAGHLSGIRHYGPGEFLNTTHYTSATDSLRKFAADPLLTPPGAKYVYSSYAYDVLGAVIERVTGKPFDAAMKTLVFDPLGMNQTSFTADATTAAFYDQTTAGPQPAPPTDLSDRLSAGAAVTTARDLARLLIATSGGPFLSDASRTTMFTSQKTKDGKETGTGIAWRIAIDDKGRTYVRHGGAVTGGRAFALVYPKERVAVAIVTNLGFAAFNEKDAGAIAMRFLVSKKQ
jgi:serine beta-lactamase-like protein LACTB, mitochondrial